MLWEAEAFPAVPAAPENEKSLDPINRLKGVSMITFAQGSRQNHLVPLEGLEPDMRPFGSAGEGQEPSVLLGFLTLRDHCDQAALFQLQSKCSQKLDPLSVSSESQYLHLGC